MLHKVHASRPGVFSKKLFQKVRNVSKKGNISYAARIEIGFLNHTVYLKQASLSFLV